MAALPKSIIRLRRLLLVLLLVLVGGLVALYLFGRAGRPKPVSRTAEQGGQVTDDHLTVVGEGFNYRLADDGRPLFELEGDSYRVDRDGKVFLDEIEITVYSEDDQPYQVSSTEAVFDPSTEETLLQGTVGIRGPQGMDLDTTRLELTRKGQRLLAHEPVDFRYQDTAQGRADRMRVDLDTRIFVVAGNVVLEDGPGAEKSFEVKASRLLFERPRRHIRADRAVEVTFEDHFLRAQRVNLWLQEGERYVQFLRALKNVRGQMAAGGAVDLEVAGREGSGEGPAETGTVWFVGRTLSAVFEPQSSDLRRFELEGWPWRPTRLLSLADGEPPRRLSAGYIAGNLDGGLLSRTEAFGGVELVELVEPPTRDFFYGRPRVRQAILADREAEEDDLEAGDSLEEDERPENVGEGPRPDLDAAGGDEPVEELSAELKNEGGAASGEERGDIGSDESVDPFDDEDVEPGPDPPDDEANILRRITAERAETRFSAAGKLNQVTFLQNVVFTDPQVKARSEKAVFDLEIGTGELTGKKVQIESPQGDLTAPRVLYTEGSGLLYAEGGVRTQLREERTEGSLGGSPLARGEGPIWVESEKAFLRNTPSSFLYQGNVRAWRGENLLLANELQGDETDGRLVAQGNVRTLWFPEEEGASGTSGGDAAKGSPIEVTANTMVYAQSAHLLTYKGKARAVQGSRILACEEITIKLDENDQAETLFCEKDVRIEDRTAGRTITGDKARYELDGKNVEVEGEKVVLLNADGAEVTGRRLTYEFGTGVAQVQGRPPGEAPETGESPRNEEDGGGRGEGKR